MNLNRQSGVGMIEIMVTTLVLAIGLVGLAALNLESVRANTDAMKRSQNIWVVDSLVEQMHANPAGARNYLNADDPPLPPFKDDDDTPCAEKPTDHCSDGAELSGNDLDECQQFREALWNAACATSLGAPASGIVGMPGGTLDVQCQMGGDGQCDPGDPVQLQAQWTNKVDLDDDDSVSTITQVIVP